MSIKDFAIDLQDGRYLYITDVIEAFHVLASIFGNTATLLVLSYDVKERVLPYQ